jgi:hypothetical protein
MEHSEEYYKMKYFKYKAKYEQAKIQQSGGFSTIKRYMGRKDSSNKPTVQLSDEQREQLIKEAHEFVKSMNPEKTECDLNWAYLNDFNKLKSIIETTEIKDQGNKIKTRGFELYKTELLLLLSSYCNNNGKIADYCLPENSAFKVPSPN